MYNFFFFPSAGIEKLGFGSFYSDDFVLIQFEAGESSNTAT